jgi:KaiC/GvpD/RAD55 family RecA-like ATPase
LNSAGVAAFPRFVRERIPRLSYRSIRGSPKCGKTLLSPNQVIADIRSPSSVRANNAYGRAMSVWGEGR